MSLYGLVGVVALGGMATALQAHFMGIMVDQFGWMGAEARPLNLARLAGMVLLLTGTWLITRN